MVAKVTLEEEGNETKQNETKKREKREFRLFSAASKGKKEDV